MLPRLRIALLALTFGPALAACADLAEVAKLAPKGVDPRSPIAAQASAAAARDYAYPRFSDVPGRPKDVRSADAWKAAVVSSIDQRRDLKGWTAANPAMTSDTEGFAVAGRAAIPPDVLKPLDDTAAEPTAAYVERLRKAGAAPPPLPKGPAPTPLPR